MSTSLVPSYRVSWWHLYNAFTLKTFYPFSCFLEQASGLIEDDNSKFPWKYSSQSLEFLQVCSSMLSFFSALISLKYTIHNTNQQAIKHLLLKTNNKRNRTIGNSVEKSFGYCNQVLDHYNSFFMLYRSWFAKSGLWSLTGKNCVADELFVRVWPFCRVGT